MVAMLLALPAFFFALSAYSVEDNPQACDCETVEISQQEEAGGCSAQVKEKACPLYRETRIWKERLHEQQERRRLEKRMEVPNIPHR